MKIKDDMKVPEKMSITVGGKKYKGGDTIKGGLDSIAAKIFFAHVKPRKEGGKK